MSIDMQVFSTSQGNLLIRLLLSHILADFVCQTNKMVIDKRWHNKAMIFHIMIVFTWNYALTFNLFLSVIIAIAHYFVDGVKTELTLRNILTDGKRFAIEQAAHVIIILTIWSSFTQNHCKILFLVVHVFTNYDLMLILLGYFILIWPIGYLIKHGLEAVDALSKDSISDNAKSIDSLSEQKDKKDKIEHGGKLIGVFERIIILTFVLLHQYEAIGFLITGKSIIRFAERDNLRSEYVLVGTMMSYAFSIIIGVLINWLTY